MSNQKLLLVSIGFGLAVFSSGGIALAQQDNQSTMTVGMPGTSNMSTPAADSSGGSSAAVPAPVGDIGPGEVGAPSEQGTRDRGTTIEVEVASRNFEDSTIFSSDIYRRNIATGNDDFGQSSSQTFTCKENSCVSDEHDGGDSITLSEVAKLIESDLKRALNVLIAAEQVGDMQLSRNDESNVRRNITTVTEARQIVETKLDRARTSIEQINKLKPENSLW